MSSGKSTVGLRLKLLPGTPGSDEIEEVVAYTSLGVLTSIIAAARGAFPDEFGGGPFDPDLADAAAAMGRKGAEVRRENMTDEEQAEHMKKMREARWPTEE